MLYTADIRVLNHILTHSMTYFKPPENRKTLSSILGEGVFASYLAMLESLLTPFVAGVLVAEGLPFISLDQAWVLTRTK